MQQIRFGLCIVAFVLALTSCVDLRGADTSGDKQNMTDAVTTVSTSATADTTTTTTHLTNHTFDGANSRPTGKFTVAFSNFDEYVSKLKTFTDKKVIFACGNEMTEKDPEITETDFDVLLQEKYFLAPVLPQQYLHGTVFFLWSGQTYFLAANPTYSSTKLEIVMYHGKEATIPQQSKARQYAFVNERGKEIVRHGKERPSYIWEEEDMAICVSVQGDTDKIEEHLTEYEQFLKTLTFEKVEIK